ncbi:MAG: Peptidyl-prolyl cis-trans isomerase [Berkelbacteria bacterium GW2011_GWA2_35_9]|uniref:Peptidyl-prolyl cis-trans isomerase n=1 Tax=Berkelbacteria bacterium GW2011_GWA2_35_9 TaxID=1618333 RepID=A0A0G0D0S1_9BACT|nr:MAG: Peptidyl-prolyl cis-trans isomerase [Berkelbacteria bacterium GW2011_GWA2_35_9]
MKNFGMYVVAISVIILLGFMFMSGDKSSNTTTTINKQGGELKKEITQEGSGENTKKGDTVSVNYVGKLTDGTEFDNSYNRGEPIEFILGSGQVIQGWDQGIEGMKVGEKATLTIPSNLGYGATGSPPLIPANATLIFDVELVGIK